MKIMDEKSKRQKSVSKNAKQRQLDQYRISNVGKPMMVEKYQTIRTN